MKIITGESIRIEQTMKCHWMDWCVLCVSAWKQCVCYKIVNIYINMLLRWKNCNGLDGKRENAKYVAPFGGMWFIIWFRFVCFLLLLLHLLLIFSSWFTCEFSILQFAQSTWVLGINPPNIGALLSSSSSSYHTGGILYTIY